SSKKRRLPCKFCGKDAEYAKLYDDFFCPKCLRFQKEGKVSEVKLLPIFKLKIYNFNAQKHTYLISNELESRIGLIERRDLSKYIGKKDYNIRYYFLNDVKRIIGSVDGRIMNKSKDADASWKIYDYGRNLRGEIKHIVATDTWQILDSANQVIAIRDAAADSKVALQTAKQFTLVDVNDPEHKLFRINRKIGFRLQMLSDTADIHFAWAMVISIHRRYYL
ncbi:MAG: hypothetical protein ACTSSH_10380, partial [Candidatus Heimdallarchaeota archaeon]